MPASGLGPFSQNLLGLLHLLIRAGEVKLHFAGAACDVDLNGGQTVALHAQMQLLVSFAWTVALEACHGQHSTAGGVKARGIEVFIAGGL